MQSQCGEDYVQYRIFVVKDGNEIETDETILERIRLELLREFQQIIDDYIWYSDPFHLEIVSGIDGKRGTTHLAGKQSVGDCIEDEWVVVVALRELSKKRALLVSVEDADGQFLLIEAASYLPKWLSPENSSNRLWFFHGTLQLIPREVRAISDELGVDEALRILLSSETQSSTVAPMKLQRCIDSRLHECSVSMTANNRHVAFCTVPRSVAHALTLLPQLIAPAVRSFHYRDPNGLRACSQMARFPPQEMVTIPVRFSRILFAQTAQQQFFPPKKSKWSMPPVSSPQYNAADLGLKVTCGFEILNDFVNHRAQDARPLHEREQRWNSLLQARRDGADVANEQATYLQQLMLSAYRDDCAIQKVLLDAVLDVDMPTAEQFAAAQETVVEDSCDWMNVSEEDVEKLLERRRKLADDGGPMDLSDDELDDTNDAIMDSLDPESVSQIIETMNRFMDDENAGLEGAEPPVSAAVANGTSDFHETYTGEQVILDQGKLFQLLAGALGTPIDVQKHHNAEQRRIKEIDEQLQSEMQHSGLKLQLEHEENNAEEQRELNLVSNLLESYIGQSGTSGPVSNMLGMFKK